MAVTITNPVQYRVFQRSGTTGTIAINGTYTGTLSAIEASFNGGAYQTIDSNPSGGNYSGNLTSQTQGQGTLTVRKVDIPAESATVTYIGIGDIFVIAGQSNAVGYATNNQLYYHPTLKACLFGNDYNWKELVDPVDSTTNQVDSVSDDDIHGSGAYGSCWPIAATYIMQCTGVPVAFVPCPLASTSIADWQPGANHQDRTTLYGSMCYRAIQVSAKYILWWQGEQDSLGQMPESTYNSYLDTIANTFASDVSGGKIMPCKIFDLDAGLYQSDETPINNAIVTAWGDNSNVLTGPDFNDYKLSEHGGGLHYPNAWCYWVGMRWYLALKDAFGWSDYLRQANSYFKIATTIDCAFQKSVQNGNLIFVAVLQQVGTEMTSSCISDNQSNTYHLIDVITTYSGDSDFHVGIWYADNVTGGAVIITFTGVDSCRVTMAIAEYTGVSASSPLDKYATGQDTGGTALSSGNTSQTLQADELLVGVWATYSGSLDRVTPGANYYLRSEMPDYPGTGPMGFEDRIVSSTGTYAATATQALSCGWICKIATFKLTPAALDQEGFRWRDDDGDEDGASWLASQDVNITRAKALNTRVRGLLNATLDPAAAKFLLEYKRSDEQFYKPMKINESGVN